MQEITFLERTPDLVLGLAGEIDSQNAEEFYEKVAAAYSARPSDVILDCTKLEFIDSTTLGILVKLNKDLQTGGHRLILRHLSPRLKKLFVICALDKVMEIS